MEESEILEHILTTLLRDFNGLDSRITRTVPGDEITSTLVNSRNKIAKSIIDCIALLANPRYVSLSADTQDDLAKILKSFNERQSEKVGLQSFKLNLRGRKRKTTRLIKDFETMAKTRQELGKLRQAQGDQH